MYPASTTKLITAILLAQNRTREDILFYSQRAKASYPYKLDLPAGTELKASYAMDALLLFSGNDIAYMIAENIDKDIEHFSQRMNSFIRDLGLKNTHLCNPSGLHEGNHYTTAYDLSVVARALYAYPWIMETITKKNSVLYFNNNQEIQIKNRNKLVTGKGCTGGKTGWTPKAGRCLVALFERDARRIAGVVLGSIYNPEDTIVFEDMEKIIDYSYEVKKESLIKADSIVKTIPVRFRIVPLLGPVVSRSLKLKIKEPVNVYMNSEPVHISFSVPHVDIFQLDKNKPAGLLTVKQRETKYVFKLYPAFSSHDILRWDILPFYTATISIILIIIFLTFIITIALKKK
jgi:D-alanyl-D-alanine carboxypeptidase